MNDTTVRDKFYAEIVEVILDYLMDSDYSRGETPTEEQCKQIFYEKWGPSEEENPMVHVGDYIDAVHLSEFVPRFLINKACAYALSLINWMEIAIRVEEELDEYST